MEPSVLLVDDQPKLAVLVHALLSRLGFNDVDVVSDGAAAIGAAQRKTYALIICDLAMEPVDGLQVLKALRAAPATARVPFIVTEETFEHQEVAAAVSMGADGILLKPYEIELFRGKIRQALMSAGRPRVPRETLAHQAGGGLPEMLAAYTAALPARDQGRKPAT